MNLEDQVCDLQYAKRLDELGVKQESLFCWYSFENPLNNVVKESDLDDDMWRVGLSRDASKGGADWTYPAYTVAELGEFFPEFMTIDHSKSYKSWVSFCYEDNFSVIDEKEVNARARMLIHLLENNLVKAEDLK